MTARYSVIYNRKGKLNKQGNFYGKRKWEHLCDVVLRFEDGMVGVEKNRFGGVGEYET